MVARLFTGALLNTPLRPGLSLPKTGNSQDCKICEIHEIHEETYEIRVLNDVLVKDASRRNGNRPFVAAAVYLRLYDGFARKIGLELFSADLSHFLSPQHFDVTRMDPLRVREGSSASSPSSCHT